MEINEALSLINDSNDYKVIKKLIYLTNKFLEKKTHLKIQP